MREFISRILDGLTACLVRQAERLVRLSAARHLVGEYQAAYDDAAVLEAGGKKHLAEFLRNELDEALDGTTSVTSLTPAEAVPLSLDRAGDRGPFVLSGPAPAAVAGTLEAPAAVVVPAKRRGRPRKAATGRRSKRETKREVAAETTDESRSSTLIGG